jgi:diaminopimelate epimerase
MIPFTKMHGLGNDFVVIDNRDSAINLSPQAIQTMAHRHTGIGFDQLLMLTTPPHEAADFGYQIYNANGQAVGQCGNGARCLAHFIHHHKISDQASLCFATSTTTMQVTRTDASTYTVSLPCPQLDPATIPFNTNQSTPPFPLTNQAATCYVANVGNPHAIIPTQDLDNAPLDTLGANISTHEQFPQHTNVSFMKIISPTHIQLRVYERGAGETAACGSAACAAMAVGHTFQSLADEVTIDQPGGSLQVQWPGPPHNLQLKGPSALVYTGIWLA